VLVGGVCMVEFLTSFEAAKFCRRSKNNFLDLVRRGEAPSPIPGSSRMKLLFSRPQLERWMLYGELPNKTQAQLKPSKNKPTAFERKLAEAQSCAGAK